jgi:hypothetical protein
VSTREEREAAAEAAEDRTYWAMWEENHYDKPSFREAVVTERAEEAEWQRKGGKK